MKEETYMRSCRCGHVTVTSFHPIEKQPVLPCCTTGRCPWCEEADQGKIHRHTDKVPA